MSSPTRLTVMSYNIQMTPSVFNLYFNWWNRQPHFVSYIKQICEEQDPDVIIFEEAFYTKTIDTIRELAEILPVFRYQTPILSSPLVLSCCRSITRAGLIKKPEKGSSRVIKMEETYKQMPLLAPDWNSLSGNVSSIKYLTSGVIIVSKHPIKQSHGLIYTHGSFPDSLGSKGAAFVQIEKEGKLFNIVGTHLQSGNKYNKIRLEQIAEIADWLKGEKYPAGPSNLLNKETPLIFAGDFNMRFIEDMKYLQMALSPQLLDARTILPRSSFDMQTTYDTELNQLCNIEEGYPITPKKVIYDYLFLSNSHGGSVAKYQESIYTKSKEEIKYTFFKFGLFPYKHTHIKDLSDHFAIVGSFYWDRSPPKKNA